MNLSQGDSKFTIQKGDEEEEDLCRMLTRSEYT